MNETLKEKFSTPAKQTKGYQFGTFQGVFTPSILTILGVIMYLRFGWVLGSLGLARTLIIVTMSTAVTFITAFSIAQFATNMRMGGGGAYYIISRSLGVEAGGAIGLPLFFAKALGISFYVVGFSESIVGLYPGLYLQGVGVATLVILTILAYFSADIALKVQYIVLVLIIASLVSFFSGSYQPAMVTGTVETVVPFAKSSFWLVFAIFFPAVTGIEAGLSMSGDLKNAEKSLTRGTIAAVLISYLIYLAIPLYLIYLGVSEQELITNNFIMRDVARWGSLIIYGLWAASISSALGALLGAPRTLQALANDGVIHRAIGKGYGKKNDPRLATIVSFLVALAGIMLGDLNAIAAILTTFFLVTYGLLNFAAGIEGLISNPSWRPKVKMHWAWPMLGALSCLMIMMMISPGATILASLVIFAVYYLMQRRRINAYWGDTKYGILMLVIRTALYKLVEKKPHEKTWRPNILVLSGAPSSRWHLIEIADAMSHGKGFLTIAAILSKEDVNQERIDNMQTAIYSYIKERYIPAIVKVVTAPTMIEGAQKLVNTYGFGPLVPNTILLGVAEKAENYSKHAELFRYIFNAKKNLLVVREIPRVVTDRTTAQIDLWWSHVGKNAGLMLALAYLLKTSPEWTGARLVIKSIVKNEEEKKEQLEYFREFIKKENMAADIAIFVKDTDHVFELMQRESQDADIVFMGVKSPGEDESTEDYGKYYEALNQNTQAFPAIVFVLAAEDINFDRIFKLREAH